MSTDVTASAATAATERLDAQHAIPQGIAADLPAIGLRWKGETLVVAAPRQMWTEAERTLRTEGFTVEFVDVDETDVREAIALAYTVDFREDSSIELLYSSLTGEAPIAKLVDRIIERAVFERASDLHIEPWADAVHVRVRVDGRLRRLVDLPADIGPAIASRIKVLSQLNIVERRRPQDGQFTASLAGRHVDVRVATAATMYGEKVVLRLHDARRPLVTLDELGMSRQQLATFTKLIMQNNGLILAAGPTGSGKTTTLHSALRAVNTPTKNVTTIEDPIEYVVQGINQIPVNEATGNGFATQLRAILRQDPDIILVGETRDAETARISVQASLTGHLVLTSIHATDAVGAIYRLLQMDIEPHLVASSVSGIISQRLVRRICSACAEPYEPTARQAALLERFDLPGDALRHGIGCTFCGGSGYRDRVAAYQILALNEHLSELISGRPEPVVFRREALGQGMTTIASEALVLASQGITTIEEALTLMDLDMRGDQFHEEEVSDQ